MITKQCFYGRRNYGSYPGTIMLIDLAIPHNGELIGAYSGETLEQIQARYPDAAIGDTEDVRRMSDDSFKSPPAEITREEFHQSLDCLPPQDWTRRHDAESFKAPELISGDIAHIYARIGGRYFTLDDHQDMPHEQIIAAVRAKFPD